MFQAFGPAEGGATLNQESKIRLMDNQGIVLSKQLHTALDLYSLEQIAFLV